MESSSHFLQFNELIQKKKKKKKKKKWVMRLDCNDHKNIHSTKQN